MKRKEEKKREDFELLEKDPPHTRERRYHAETFYETSNHQYVPNLEM